MGFRVLRNSVRNQRTLLMDNTAANQLQQEMAMSVEAPQQYKQPSRKGKKAWRKNVDVTEIEAGLENTREEVIRGSA